MLLWAIRRVAEAQSPTFELAVSTLQLISQASVTTHANLMLVRIGLFKR
jgi:flagellar biogenesis protein FliO